jgi:dihydroorotase
VRYDVLVKGGELVDPIAGRVVRADVAINRDRIAVVDRDIPAGSAFRIIDATGRYVTPGLVDLNATVDWRGHPRAVNPDVIAPRTGVTTWVDTGSVGPMNIEGFRENVSRPATVRVVTFLRLGPPGHETANISDREVDLLAHVTNQNRDLVMGVSATMLQGSTNPIEQARRAADALELPLLAYLAHSPPGVAEILDRLHSGDIVTHAFSANSMRIVDEAYRILDTARRAWDRGVIFDLGHGERAFCWRTAEALLAAGFPPHTISTNSHQLSVQGPMFDLPTCLSKFLHLGMTLPEVIRRATAEPARVLGMEDEIGTFRTGARADLALFRLLEGRFPLYDQSEIMREARQLLFNTLTIVGGRPLEQRGPPSRPAWLDWAMAGGFEPSGVAPGGRSHREFQRRLAEWGHVPEVMAAEAIRAAGG